MSEPHVLTTADGPLAYHLLGDGVPRVVLLPGWGLNVPFLRTTATWQIWQEWAQSHPLLILDRRGAGESRTNQGDVTPEQLAADLLAVLDDAGGGPVTVWAQADAALGVLPLVAQQPGPVERLVLQAPFPRLLAAPDVPDGMSLAAMLALAMLDPAAPVLSELDALGTAPDAQGDPLTRLRATLAAGLLPRMLTEVASVDARPVLPAVKTPALVLHGSADTVILPAAGAAVARLMPSARFEAIEAMGHLAAPDHLRALHAHVDAFLQG